MHMSIYTKQIGNCLNNLVLAKTGTLIYENPFKGIAKRVTVLTKVKYHKPHKLGKECHNKFYNHILIGHMMSMKCY
jgi:hypothetical protein